MQSLNEIESNILDLLKITEYKDTNKPDPSVQRAAKYEVGVQLAKARNHFGKDDRRFGEWCMSSISEKCLTSKIHQTTLHRYRQLPKYGALEDCEKLGFTNVYKVVDKPELVDKLKVSEDPKLTLKIETTPINSDEVKQIGNETLETVMARMATAAKDGCLPSEILMIGLYGDAEPELKTIKQGRNKFHPDKGGYSHLSVIANSLYVTMKEVLENQL